MTLEEFVKWRRIDEQPYLEYYDGRFAERKAGARSHSVLMSDMTRAFDRYAKHLRLGMAFLALRCTFGRRSIVGDVIFLREAQILRDEQGYIMDETNAIPDILVEIRSPEESIEQAHAKFTGSIAEGCPLGWFIDPCLNTIDVFRPGQPPERLPEDGFLDASPILPGFRVALAEVFGWLIYRKPEPDPQ
jgi:Uma2 family endonuclease